MNKKIKEELFKYKDDNQDWNLLLERVYCRVNETRQNVMDNKVSPIVFVSMDKKYRSFVAKLQDVLTNIGFKDVGFSNIRVYNKTVVSFSLR